MARNVGRAARRMWSCCSSAARNAVSENCASSSSSTSSSAAAGARPLPRNSVSSQQLLFSGRRQSVRFARLPGEVGSISSMIPRHNAIAAARLVSRLSNDLTPEIEGILARYVTPI